MVKHHHTTHGHFHHGPFGHFHHGPFGHGGHGHGHGPRFNNIKIAPGQEEATGTDMADRFIVSSSRKNADVITINDFELGEDSLHLGRVKHFGADMEWISADGDGEVNDLQIVVKGQTIVLTDLADQVEPTPVYRYQQDFESDTGAWSDSNSGWYGTATQVASGTDGIASASGDYHVVLEGEATGDNDWELTQGPFDTLMNAGEVAFEPYTVSIEIYLDPQADGGSGWADGEGFDYSVASNRADDSGFLADFIFHVTQDTGSGEMFVFASNNTNFTPREDLDAQAGSAAIDEDGWYTFEHHFYENGAGDLAVDMVVLNEEDEIVFSMTRTSPSFDIADVNGEPRYAWFTDISVDDGLPVDDLTIAYDADQEVPLPGADDIFFGA